MMSREWYEPECCEGTQPMKTRVWEKYYFLTYDNPDAHDGLAWMNPEGEKRKEGEKEGNSYQFVDEKFSKMRCTISAQDNFFFHYHVGFVLSKTVVVEESCSIKHAHACRLIIYLCDARS